MLEIANHELEAKARAANEELATISKQLLDLDAQYVALESSNKVVTAERDEARLEMQKMTAVISEQQKTTADVQVKKEKEKATSRCWQQQPQRIESESRMYIRIYW